MKSLIGTDIADYLFALSVPFRTEYVCLYYLLPVYLAFRCPN